MTKTKRHLIYFVTITKKKNNIKNEKQIQKNKELATARSLVGVQLLTAASIPIITLLVITHLRDRDLFIAKTAYRATTEPLVDSTEWLVRPPNV